MPRIKIEDIIKEANNLNWKLVSETYKNLDTEMEFICPQNHNVFTTYAIWRANHTCPICDAPKIELSNKVAPCKKGATRLLALDQATHTTGWAIYDDDTVIKYGLIKSKGNTTEERINFMKVWLANMVEIWKPDKVCLEDIQLQEKKNRTFENDDGDNVIKVTTYKILAQLMGVLIDYLLEKKIRFETVHTAVWRESCHISGKYRTDKKKSAQLKIKEWFNLDVTNDEADALCIGKYASAHEKKNTSMMNWE